MGYDEHGPAYPEPTAPTSGGLTAKSLVFCAVVIAALVWLFIN